MRAMQTKLDIAIRKQLAVRKGDWNEIAQRAGVSHSWMSKFVNGHIKNPGIRTLEKLGSALKPNRARKSRAVQELTLPTPTKAEDAAHA